MSSRQFHLNAEIENTSKPIAVPPASSARATSFIGLSAIVHTAAMVTLMVVNASLFEAPKVETVEIQLADSSEPVKAAAPAAPAPAASPAQAAEAAPAAQAEATAIPTQVDDLAPAEELEAPPVTAKAPAVKTKSSAPAKSARTAPKAAAKTVAMAPQVLADESPVEVPQSVQALDESQQDLDDAAFEAKQTGEMNAGELDSSFAKADEESMKGVAAAKGEMDQDANDVDQQSDDHIAALEKQNADQAQALKQQENEMKARNAKALGTAIASAEADERAQAAAQARAAAAEQARAKQAAAAAAAAQAAANAKKGNGSGNGKTAGGTATGSSSGTVRRLDQLRQMPGNPKPSYNESERYARQNGQVTYLAYIGKDGRPSQFKQTQSTGFANLDSKTLEALKKWRFYPGQEGWVEIPMKWELLGGAKETSALSKRKVSRQ